LCSPLYDYQRFDVARRFHQQEIPTQIFARRNLLFLLEPKDTSGGLKGKYQHIHIDLRSHSITKTYIFCTQFLLEIFENRNVQVLNCKIVEFQGSGKVYCSGRFTNFDSPRNFWNWKNGELGIRSFLRLGSGVKLRSGRKSGLFREFSHLVHVADSSVSTKMSSFSDFLKESRKVCIRKKTVKLRKNAKYLFLGQWPSDWHRRKTFFPDLRKISSLWGKIWIWNTPLCWIRGVFRLFSRAKTDFSKVAVETRKAVLEPKSDGRKRHKRRFLVSSKVTYF
jgi:hypothetical protein